jgi:hypothetical protein
MIIKTYDWKANSFSFLVASAIDNDSLELYQRRIVENYGQWKISKSLFFPVTSQQFLGYYFRITFFQNRV